MVPDATGAAGKVEDAMEDALDKALGVGEDNADKEAGPAKK